MTAFNDFQYFHNRMIESLNDLLKKGDQILVHDIKKIKDQITKEINQFTN